MPERVAERLGQRDRRQRAGRRQEHPVAAGPDEAGRERRRTGHDVEQRHVDAVPGEPVTHERARRVVADAAGEGDGDAEAGEGNGRGGRRSATREHAVGCREALVGLRETRHGDDRIERGMSHAHDGGTAGDIGHGRTQGGGVGVGARMPDPMRLRRTASVGDALRVMRSTAAEPSAPALAIVADDLTGAADVAGILRRSGVRVSLDRRRPGTRVAGAGDRGHRGGAADPDGTRGGGRGTRERRGGLAARGRDRRCWPGRSARPSTPRRPATSAR